MRWFLTSLSLALLAAGPAAWAAPALERATPLVERDDAPVVLASGDCSAAANAWAQSYPDAQILSVQQSGGGGDVTCTVVLRVKEASGKQPRVIKQTFKP